MRESLDEYIAQIYPSGGDGWISTDEREGVRAIASECVQYTLAEWECATEALTGEEKAPIGKIPHGLKMKS